MYTWFRLFPALASVCVLHLVSAGTAAGFDQESLKNGEGRGFFMAGTNQVDISALNTRLKNNGYHTFSDNFMAVGGGGYGIRNRLVIGGEGFGIFSGDESGTAGGETFKTTLRGGYGLFKLGYVVYKRSGLSLYPTFGFGGGGMALEITRKETVPFDDILKSPKRYMNLATGSFLVDIGMGMDYLVILNRKETGEEGGLSFGARLGYLFSPYRSEWGDAIDGPDIGIEGFYFRLMFGGGGRKEK